MAELIHDQKSFARWLADKPADWAQLIALRSALRVLPVIGLEPTNAQLHLAVLRAVAILWAARKFPAHNIATDAALRYLVAAGYSNDDTYTAVDAAADAASSAADARDAFHGGAIIFAAAAASMIAGDAGADAARLIVWNELREDVAILERGGAERLFGERLWFDVAFLQIAELRDRLFKAMIESDPSARFWAQWYHRREQGVAHGFLLDSAADDAVTLRLVEQDDAFWDRDPREVNTEIGGWITEVERLAILEELERPLPHAIGLRFDEQNQLRFDPSAGVDALAHDPDAVDRHTECHRLARRLANACQTEIGANSAAELIEDCELFLEALGTSVDTMRPMLVVMRFVTLEQALAGQDGRDPSSDLPAFPDRVLGALRALVRNAGIFVALDRELAETYRAKAGADALVPISPFAARSLVNSAKDAGLTDDEVPAIISAQARHAENPNADEAAAARLTRDTSHVVRRLFGRIWSFSQGVFKNAKNVETVGGWLVNGWRWVEQNAAQLLHTLPGGPGIANAIHQIIEWLGRYH